jgi:ATP diphosphatase
VGLARRLGVDPEAALRGANRRFERRYRHMEQRLAEEGRAMAETGLAELKAHWQAAKRATDDPPSEEGGGSPLS